MLATLISPENLSFVIHSILKHYIRNVTFKFPIIQLS